MAAHRLARAVAAAPSWPLTVGAGGRAGALALLRRPGARDVLEALGVLVGGGVAVVADGNGNHSFPQSSGPGAEGLAGLGWDGLAARGTTCPEVGDPLGRPAAVGVEADPAVGPVTVLPVGVAGAAAGPVMESSPVEAGVVEAAAGTGEAGGPDGPSVVLPEAGVSGGGTPW